MPYYPPPVTGFVPLDGSLPMTGRLTTPGVSASASGTLATPAFAINTNYGLSYNSGGTRLVLGANGVEVASVNQTLGFAMYGANTVVDANRTVIAASSTTAGVPAYAAGGLRYITDLEGASGIAFGGIGNVYRNIVNGQVVTAAVSGMGVLSEFTGFCNYTYRTIVQNTHAMLTNAGLLAKLTGFYVFAVPTNQNDALINWATPGTRNATITGTPVFTPNQGFTGDSATALITAGGNIASFGGSQNNVTAGCYVLVANTAGAAERAVIGQNVPGQGRRTTLTSFTSGGLHTIISTQVVPGDPWTPPRYTGLFVLSRNLSTGYNDSVDDVAATPITSTSVVLGSTVCWLGTNDSSGTSFSNAQVACGFVGVGLTTTDVANLRTIIRDYYLTQIGAISANYTVALLPLVTSVPAGTRYNVTDATLTTFASTVIGGGTNFVPVINNGTNWIIG